ncbi:hypothetical protein XENTR_v10004718 [Xenopus tropicalis]|nr:hypothetical protein XENTR_v10004718 [Xenopus tropicalis]
MNTMLNSLQPNLHCFQFAYRLKPHFSSYECKLFDPAYSQKEKTKTLVEIWSTKFYQNSFNVLNEPWILCGNRPLLRRYNIAGCYPSGTKG